MHQDAFHEVDTYASLKKQYIMMKLVMDYYDLSTAALSDGVGAQKLMDMPVRERIGRIKYVPEDKVLDEYNSVLSELEKSINELKTNIEE